MNICFIHSVDLTVDSAPSIHVREIVKNLAVKNNIFLLVDRGDPSENIKVFPINIPKIKGFTYLFTVFCSFIVLKNLIDKNKIEIIYCRDIFSSFSAILLSKMKKIPFVFEVNGILSDEAKIKKQNGLYIFLIKIFERFVFRNADALICVTENIKRYIESEYNRKNIYCVPNGVNTDLFKPIKNAKKFLKLDENYFYVGFIGSFKPWQGLNILIKSAPEIVKNIPNVKFLLVGDGIEKKKLIKIIEELNLQKYFILTGRIPYEEVPNYINACDVCTIPKLSLKSGYSPLKLYEYMACEKSVIASKIEGFEILERNNAGILVDPENPEDLSKAIIKLLKNEELRKEMGKNGRKYVVENHSWKKIAEKIEEICFKIVGESK